MKKYNLTFQFFNSEAEAKTFCDQQNATATAYIRRNKPAHYTPQYHDASYVIIDYFIAWYYY